MTLYQQISLEQWKNQHVTHLLLYQYDHDAVMGNAANLACTMIF